MGREIGRKRQWAVPMTICMREIRRKRWAVPMTICMSPRAASSRDTRHQRLSWYKARRASHLEQPVVGRAAGFELERAQGVGDVLKGVVDAVGEVVRGIYAPLVARLRQKGGNQILSYRHIMVSYLRSHNYAVVMQGPKPWGVDVRRLLSSRRHAASPCPLALGCSTYLMRYATRSNML